MLSQLTAIPRNGYPWVPIGYPERLFRENQGAQVASFKLTKRAIDALEPNAAGDYIAWDAELKGFGVRVRTSARKVYVLKYRVPGQRRVRRLVLGTHGALTLDEARRLAKRHLGAITDGADPAHARARARRAPTVRELGADYLADVDARRKLTTAREYRRLWEKHLLPALGTTKVAAVTSADVARLHRRMRARPYLANRVLALLGAFFAFAEREGVRARADNPAHGVAFYPEQARERFLTASEFAALGAAMARAERDGLPPASVHRRRPKSAATTKHRAPGWGCAPPREPLRHCRASATRPHRMPGRGDPLASLGCGGRGARVSASRRHEDGQERAPVERGRGGGARTPAPSEGFPLRLSWRRAGHALERHQAALVRGAPRGGTR